MSVTCNYCKGRAAQITGRDLYPHRPDLAQLQFWACRPCDAYVGCHPDGSPKGTLANATLRISRRQAHALFDPLWTNWRQAYPDARHYSGLIRRTMRKRAYEWLAEQLAIPFDSAHIAMFDEQMCARVIEVIRATKITAAGVRKWAKALRVTA